jgi:hypothetical protein
MMRKPIGVRLASGAALLLSWDIGLLVCHALSRRAAGDWMTAWPG